MLSIIGFALLSIGSIWAATTYNHVARWIGGAIAAFGLFIAFY
tara:strand:- start:36681 stop:36809 length:129 start_codon:yes stop_codon:yes gene_type:complete